MTARRHTAALFPGRTAASGVAELQVCSALQSRASGHGEPSRAQARRPVTDGKEGKSRRERLMPSDPQFLSGFSRASPSLPPPGGGPPSQLCLRLPPLPRPQPASLSLGHRHLCGGDAAARRAVQSSPARRAPPEAGGAEADFLCLSRRAVSRVGGPLPDRQHVRSPSGGCPLPGDQLPGRDRPSVVDFM